MNNFNENSQENTINSDLGSENTFNTNGESIIVPQNSINGEPLSYKTKDVANLLDETEQNIRNYAAKFENYLSMPLNREPGEHRTFTKEDINKLRFIFFLKRKKNYSIKQIQEYMSTPQGESFIIPEDEENAKKVQVLTEMFMEQVKAQMSTVVKQSVEEIIEEKVLEVLKNTLQEGIVQPFTNMECNIINQGLEFQEDLKVFIKEETERQLKPIVDMNNKLDTVLTDREQFTESMVRVEDNIAKFREKMEKREEKKGFFSNLFKK